MKTCPTVRRPLCIGARVSHCDHPVQHRTGEDAVESTDSCLNLPRVSPGKARAAAVATHSFASGDMPESRRGASLRPPSDGARENIVFGVFGRTRAWLKTRARRPISGESGTICHDIRRATKKVDRERNVTVTIFTEPYIKFARQDHTFFHIPFRNDRSKHPTMPASGSEWGSDNDSNDSEYEVSENHAKEQRTGEVSGDESEDIGSEDESPESEDDAAMAEAAKAAAEKAAKKKAKPKAKAKAKAEDPPKGTPKGTPKKPKVVSGGAATTATPPKKDESAKPKPKPKTARKAELFENEPLRNGTRNGMPPEKEADTFWAWNLAEAERQKASLEAFVANASAEKGKQTKGLVSHQSHCARGCAPILTVIL
jgi:hypothetical protein